MHSASSIKTTPTARCALLVALCAACVAPLYADPPDAVIELWEQHWTLNEDGSTVYHEKQHVRLNSDRAFDEFADPRITYNQNTDDVEIVVARVKMADGTYREPRDYSHVGLTHRSFAGWPAFANIKQHLIVMPGIEPGCVVELEYKIKSKAGAKRCLAADVRLDHQYPVRLRTVSVDVPDGTKVHSAITRLPDGVRNAASRQNLWQFADLPGHPHEPQGLPWHADCARLTFTTTESPEAWLNARLEQIDAAAVESDLCKQLADEWTKDATDDAEKLKTLQEKLAATFNFVNFNVGSWPAELRPASEVIDRDYGLPPEAAAVLLALVRTAGVLAEPALLVNDDVWTDAAPQDALVAAFVVMAPGSDGFGIWDPHHGRIYRDTRWAGHTMLCNVGGKLRQIKLSSWTNPDESRCVVRGRIDIDKNGGYNGKLTLRTSGLFVSPAMRYSNDQQRNRVSALVHQVLPGAKVDGFTVTALTEDTFEVEVNVKSDKPLEKLSDAYQLALAQDGPFTADVSVPLTSSDRRTPARLTGAFDEQIELTIEWPEGWKADAVPSGLSAVQGDWGVVEQNVERSEHGLTLTRHTRITQRDLPPDVVLALRQPLNELRSDHARTLLLRP